MGTCVPIPSYSERVGRQGENVIIRLFYTVVFALDQQVSDERLGILQNRLFRCLCR